MKKIVSAILVCALLLSLAAPTFAVSVNRPQVSGNVAAYTYQDVSKYISDAEFDIILDINGTDVHYFYGDGYTVYEEAGKYYLVHYGNDYSDVSINGYALDVAVVTTSTAPPQMIGNFQPVAAPAAVPTSSAWTYLFTDRVTVSVGGLAVTVAIGLIPVANLTAAVIKTITSFLTRKAVNGLLPNGYAVTVRDDWYYANLDPWMGTVDYKHDYSAWWGTVSYPYMEHVGGTYYTGTIIERISVG